MPNRTDEFRPGLGKELHEATEMPDKGVANPLARNQVLRDTPTRARCVNLPKAALTDEAYVKHSSAYAVHSGVQGNRNSKLIERLSEVGVEMSVSGQALAYSGYSTEEVASSVKVAFSAPTVNINKQTAGYAYLPFH
jgi:intracellular sulfur oxidation DsrE/DsrF family protein